MSPAGRRSLPGVVFLVSFASIGFELFLTRYFAVANWAEYGYWVISIAMTGLAFAGVAAGLAPGWLRRNSAVVLAGSAVAMPACAALGFHLAAGVPFNPLALQNRELMVRQMVNIGAYDLALTPFFFCVGLCLNAAFITDPGGAPGLYAADLLGAGTGAVATLLLLTRVAPFDLPLWLVPVMGIAAVLAVRASTRKRAAVLFTALATGAWLLVAGPFTRPGFFEYKAIFAPLHVEGGRVAAEYRSPRGWDLVLDDFTERLDTDLSNNYALLRAGGPPRALGLYRDGERIAAIPAGLPGNRSYLRAALDAVPYALAGRPRVLLIGSRGGFRPGEAAALGAREIVTLEPDPVIARLLPPGVETSPRVPLALLAAHPAPFDLIDIASDFSVQNEANRAVVTVEGLQACLGALAPGGMVSIPAPIKDLPVYAVICASTAREALRRAGAADPARGVLVYRSAWNSRILVFRDPVPAHVADLLRARCDERSFDLSYAAGAPEGSREIWNDLPPVSFERDVPPGDGSPRDALADDLAALFGSGGDRWIREAFFDLTPRVLDRPSPRAALRPERVGAALDHPELVPRDELPVLVAVAVGAQAAVFALLIVVLPLVLGRGGGVASAAYFGSLGLGFLFIEIILIEKASLFLGDRTSAFGLVLTGMLLCSGLGSYALRGTGGSSGGMLAVGVGVVAVWIVLAAAVGDRLLLASQGFPVIEKEVLVMLAIAPVGFALGMPFPLGLTRFGGPGGADIPWAWAVNGACSVLASPLAALLATRFGGSRVLLAAGALYLVALGTFLRARR